MLLEGRVERQGRVWDEEKEDALSALRSLGGAGRGAELGSSPLSAGLEKGPCAS